jgi:acyl-homoserine lactone acylase PvdQ
LNDTNPNTLEINERPPMIQRKASGLTPADSSIAGKISSAIRINMERQNSANDVQPMSFEERIIIASGRISSTPCSQHYDNN